MRTTCAGARINIEPWSVQVNDACAVRVLHELADEYEALAEKIAPQPDANPNKETT
jgi:hypothetical protein